MAPDMHVKQTDEVARNGAFGKILRPEVFPDAPLQKKTPFVTKVTPLNFPTALPRRSSCKLWKLSGVLPNHPVVPYGSGPIEVPLRQHQLLLHVDPRLPK